MEFEPGISIVFVNFHCEDLILRSLIGLQESLEGLEHEVIVVDNGSSKPEGFWDDQPIRYLRSEGNIGFGRACNLGAAVAKFQLLLFLNPDTVQAAGVLSAMARHLADHPGCVACSPSLVMGDGRRQVYWSFHHRLVWEVAEALYLQGVWRKIYEFAMTRRHGLEKEWPVSFISGACLLVRRSAFEAVGGFDPRFFMNFEDLELCQRLRRHGILHYLRGLSMVHEEGAVQRSDWSRYVFTRSQGHLLFIEVTYRGLRRPMARLVLAATLVSRWMVGSLLLKGDQRTRLRGYSASWQLLLGRLGSVSAARLPSR
jgi:GT2 family glycosyltransferase